MIKSVMQLVTWVKNELSLDTFAEFCFIVQKYFCNTNGAQWRTIISPWHMYDVYNHIYSYNIRMSLH